MPSLAETPSPASEAERQQLLADLFHALNQPLTTLGCSLELALHQPRTAEQYRDSLQAALQQAEHITRLAGGIRELLEAADPGDDRRVLALDGCLRETVRDWLPVAESAQVRLLLRCRAPCHVRFESRRLRQGLFHLLQYVLDDAGAGAAVDLEAAERGGEAVLVVTASRGDVPALQNPASENSEKKAQELARRLGLAIARGIFEAAGGVWQVEDGEDGWKLEVRLPLVHTDREGC
jgi:two-component system heavy metal sensor histidine kinase CusS